MNNNLEQQVQEIKDQFNEIDYGILMVFLKPDYSISIKNNRFELDHYPGAKLGWVERNIFGRYRSMHQVREDEFSLEIFGSTKLTIPYEAVEYVERLRDLPC